MTYYSSALHAALLAGDLKRARELLASGSEDVNRPDSFGSYPLLDSVRLNYSDIVASLVKAGASVVVFDSTGESPLSLAWTANRSEMVQLFLSELRRINIDVNNAIDGPNRSLIYQTKDNVCSDILRQAGLKDPYLE